MKKTKPPSRGDRWSAAVSAAKTALEDLLAIQQEYEEWKDNIEEKLSATATFQKLEDVCSIDIQGALDTVEEAEGADLPQGFGRD